MSKSIIFLYFCLSFILGVFFESLISFPPIYIGVFFVLGAILAAVFWVKDKKLAIAGFCLLVFAFGCYRSLQKNDSGSLADYNGQGVVVARGIVAEPPDRRPASQKIKILVKELRVDGWEFEASGFLLVTTKVYPAYNYGDKLELGGRLEEPENFSPTQPAQRADEGAGANSSFDYKSYLAKSDVYSTMGFPKIRVLAENQGSKLKTALFWLKQKFERLVELILPEPHASFLAGLTLGEKKSLPEELTAAFQKTGTTHIVALSGYNIGLVSSFFMTVLGWLMLKRSWRFWISVAGIVLFTILTGASASVVRAAIMGILVLLALDQGRMYNCRNALFFAGAVMIFLNPKILRFDVGFQLSFGAMAGLIWLSPIFSKWFNNWPKAYGLKEIFIATLAAQLAVLPLLVVYFGQLSLISPLVNLLVLLFIPQTMLMGFAAGIAGVLWLFLGKIFGWIVWLYLSFELAIIKFFASLPLASVKMNWAWPIAMIYYLLLVALIFLFHHRQTNKILVEQWAEE